MKMRFRHLVSGVRGYGVGVLLEVGFVVGFIGGFMGGGLGGPSVAWGQYAAPLDNNLQVGSGGVNPRVSPKINAGQAMITGNVGGLGYFHDDVGYGDPGAFRGETGSDDLFRFEARSVPSRVNLSTGWGTRNVPVRVYRTFDKTPRVFGGGLGLGAAGGGGSGGYYGGGGVNVRATGKGGYSALISRGGFGGSAAFDATSYVTTSEGQLLNVSASPLLGVRVTRSRAGGGKAGLRGNLNAEQVMAVEASESRRSALVLSGLVVDAELNRSAVTVVGTDMNLSTLPVFSTSQVVLPTIELGERISDQIKKMVIDPNNGLEGEEGEGRTEAGEANVERLSQKIFMPLNSRKYQAGDDAYLDFLARLNPKSQQSKESDAYATGSRGGKGGMAPESLESPGDQRFEEIARKRLDAMVSAFMRGEGMDFSLNGTDGVFGSEAESASESKKSGAGAGPVMSEDEAVATLRAMEKQGLAGNLDELLELLDYDMPRLESLAGRSESRLNKTLRDAEALLSAERFYNAEGRYRMALTLSPEHPLAQAGLVHAQLGAGMVRSAAYNLRRLFEAHPELIATRYDAKLLPSHSRLKSIRRNLESAAKGGQWVEPALMLAYLGYQTENSRLTEYGLNLAQVRAPKDALVVVLRRIWLDQK